LLLKLKHGSSFPVVRMNRHSHIPYSYQEVTAMGVGNTRPDRESMSDILKEVTLNAIPNEICSTSSDWLDRNLTYNGRIYPSMMCTTGGENNERDAWYVFCVLRFPKWLLAVELRHAIRSTRLGQTDSPFH
jgi:Trypsin